jgi:hydroxyacyl-ACP dehydratase HTD2-like protein with hotdog domain
MGATLDPDLQACVGRTAPPQTEVVTRRDIRKYAVATGQRLARYLDGDEAPPTFHVALFWPVVPREQLLPDGVARDGLIPEVPGRRPLAGGLKLEFHRPIRPGDVLTCTRTLRDIYEKQGTTGTLIFVEIVMQVVDANHEPVLTETTTRIFR